MAKLTMKPRNLDGTEVNTGEGSYLGEWDWDQKFVLGDMFSGRNPYGYYFYMTCPCGAEIRATYVRAKVTTDCLLLIHDKDGTIDYTVGYWPLSGQGPEMVIPWGASDFVQEVHAGTHVNDPSVL